MTTKTKPEHAATSGSQTRDLLVRQAVEIAHLRRLLAATESFVPLGQVASTPQGLRARQLRIDIEEALKPC